MESPGVLHWSHPNSFDAIVTKFDNVVFISFTFQSRVKVEFTTAILGTLLDLVAEP
jgi:hypothetical protein